MKASTVHATWINRSRLVSISSRIGPQTCSTKQMIVIFDIFTEPSSCSITEQIRVLLQNLKIVLPTVLSSDGTNVYAHP